VEEAPAVHRHVEDAVDAVLDTLGRDIVLGMPLGLGKPNPFVNALYRRAADDPALSLKIFTALTLEVPPAKNDLERRFMEPFLERLYDGYVDLAYARDRRKGALPDNVRVYEFFLQPGALIGNLHAQTNYVSSNYTHVARDILDHGVNLIAQIVARRPEDPDRISLSCNPDITVDILPGLAARQRAGQPIARVGQVHPQLPYMYGPADMPAAAFDHLIDDRDADFTLFATPRRPVAASDYAAALHVAGTVRDGGTLQIGIGALGDAVAAALILRHSHGAAFREVLAALRGGDMAGIEDTPFTDGLYGCSEMFVDGFLQLYRAGVLRRRVTEGEGDAGAVLHGGFFLGPPDFYEALRNMSEDERALFRMTPVSFVNQVYGQEDAKRAQRVHGRFVNAGMIATLMGAVISDQIDTGQVISGVGGQHNFVAQAHALEDARAILVVRATRSKGGKTQSNIVWSYGHVTVPRHMRDMIATEYGIADLRGKSDRDVIAAMLSIADSRFQVELLAQAKKAGKIEPGYTIPDQHRNNTPERIAAALAGARKAGHLPPFPFGSELTEQEQRLGAALRKLEAATANPLALARGLFVAGKPHADDLERMKLARPAGLLEWAYARLLRAALDARL
jgi:acyl-CoA hydrolase